MIGTFARAEGPGAVTPKSIRATFKRRQAQRQEIAVVDGMDADFAVVLARTSDEPGERGLAWRWSISRVPASRARREDSIDPSRKHAEITFNDAPAEALGKPGEGWAITSRVLDRAAIMTAFEQVGGADACLAMAKDYAMDRYAFGRPIASYQAIKHKLADMYVNNELARSNAYYGAWALSTDAPRAAAGRRGGARLGHAGLRLCGQGEHPDPWRHRLHLGVRLPPLLQALARTGA